MKRLCVVLVAALTVACSARTVEDGASDEPLASAAGASSASAEAPSAPVVVEFDALATERHPLSRFGGTELRLVTFLGRMGAADPCYALEPSWLNYCGGRFVQLSHPDGKDAPPQPGRGMLLAAVHPSLEMDALERIWRADRTRVTVAVHFDDPASKDCRYTDWEPQFGPRPSVEQTVETCRSILVITHVEPAN